MQFAVTDSGEENIIQEKRLLDKDGNGERSSVMPIFYFTYGSEGHPYYGGWTEVEAPDSNAACAAFRAYHPDQTKGLLNCSYVYDETSFRRTVMSGPAGNFGRRCHETITLRREAVQ